MTRISFFLILGSLALIMSCGNQTNNQQDNNVSQKQDNKTVSLEGTVVSDGDIKPVYLTTADFKKKIWDYETNPQEFLYKGELPCVIDFYADWCKPCKMVAPIMDELADYYDGKVIIYKVNTDKEKELASVFQVNSIPSILFAPMEGKPAMQPGALAKEDYIRIINEFVLKLKTENSEKI
jgi:thioredoxin